MTNMINYYFFIFFFWLEHNKYLFRWLNCYKSKSSTKYCETELYYSIHHYYNIMYVPYIHGDNYVQKYIF